MSGRRKGTPNKRTALHDICEGHGLNVFDEMVKIAAQEKDKDKRFDKMERIAPYLYAKQKEAPIIHNSIEITDSKVELQYRIALLKAKI